jgi:hypothetical protein
LAEATVSLGAEVVVVDEAIGFGSAIEACSQLLEDIEDQHDTRRV